MNKPLFTGACTALVTPFINGKVNYPMLNVLLQRQIDAGLQAVVLCGTTGEAPTLTDEEKIRLITTAKEYVGDQMLIIAGTGSNCTAHTVELSIKAQEAGVDALLVVCPYYNKPTPEGMFAHYLSVAHSVKIPVIIYNVPGRTGVDIPVSVYRRLARIPNIVGVKEASTDIGKTLQIRSQCPDDFTVWSGNDDMTVPVIALGGKGVISVSSNISPEQVHAMALAALDGDLDTAAALQSDLRNLTQLLFCETNPIPLKAAMKIIGLDCGNCRLPLPQASHETIEKLQELMI